MPCGKQPAKPSQHRPVAAVAEAQSQARHAVVLAHAAHDQEIAEPVGHRHKAGGGIAGEIDE